MEGFGGQNAHIITDTNPAEILNALHARGINEGHFNNGTFTLPRNIFAPAFLAAQKRIADLRDDIDGELMPMIIAINSDKSMRDSYVARPDEADLNLKLIDQNQRAKNVVSTLSALFPKRPVVAIFYDEQTPYELYKFLYDNAFNMKSLHKVGFGTSADEKPIIGAEFFEWVYAYPLPFDAKPVMYADTRDVNAQDVRPNLVEKLTEVIGLHGSSYITTKGKLLFPLPEALQEFAPNPAIELRPEIKL